MVPHFTAVFVYEAYGYFLSSYGKGVAWVILSKFEDHVIIWHELMILGNNHVELRFTQGQYEKNGNLFLIDF